MTMLLNYIVSVLIAWVMQRSLFRKEKQVPSSSAVVMMVILIFIPILNVVVSALALAFSYLMSDLFTIVFKQVSVLDHGAVPDGQTPSAQAFQSALSSDATHIMVPKGTYVIEEPLRIAKAQQLTGGSGVNRFTKFYLLERYMEKHGR